MITQLFLNCFYYYINRFEQSVVLNKLLFDEGDKKMMEVAVVSKVRAALETMKTTIKRRIIPETRYDEAARVYRCAVASEQALRDLEDIKSGGSGDTYRQGFLR